MNISWFNFLIIVYELTEIDLLRGQICPQCLITSRSLQLINTKKHCNLILSSQPFCISVYPSENSAADRTWLLVSLHVWINDLK